MGDEAPRSAAAGLALVSRLGDRDPVVLEEFSTPFPGFYLYYPARRQASPALRALIDYLLAIRQAR